MADEPSPVKSAITKNSENGSSPITKHVAAHLAGVDGMSADFEERLGRALNVILGDVPPGSWVGFPSIGSAIGPFLGGTVKLRTILGASLWEWSLKTAKKYGLSAKVGDIRAKIRVVDDHKPS